MFVTRYDCDYGSFFLLLGVPVITELYCFPPQYELARELALVDNLMCYFVLCFILYVSRVYNRSQGLRQGAPESLLLSPVPQCNCRRFGTNQ